MKVLSNVFAYLVAGLIALVTTAFGAVVVAASFVLFALTWIVSFLMITLANVLEFIVTPFMRRKTMSKIIVVSQLPAHQRAMSRFVRMHMVRKIAIRRELFPIK